MSARILQDNFDSNTIHAISWSPIYSGDPVLQKHVCPELTMEPDVAYISPNADCRSVNVGIAASLHRIVDRIMRRRFFVFRLLFRRGIRELEYDLKEKNFGQSRS